MLFYSLLTELKLQIESLKDTILSEDIQKEENKILTDFDKEIESQAVGTLNNLAIYQIRGWRDLIDGWNECEN